MPWYLFPECPGSTKVSIPRVLQTVTVIAEVDSVRGSRVINARCTAAFTLVRAHLDDEVL